MIPNIQHLRNIEQHLKSFWGGFEEFQWQSGPMKLVAPDFRVLKFQPSLRSSLFTFATRGMSDVHDTEKIECFILSPTPDDSLTELMTVVAWYHRTKARLDLGHTVNFGRPWFPDSCCDHGLLSVPYLDGPKLELSNSDGVLTRFLWLIPITIQERDFKVQNGLEALELRFEKCNFDYANPSRRSVIGANELMT